MIPDALQRAIVGSRHFDILHPDGSLYIGRDLLWGVAALSDHDPNVPSSAFVHTLHTADTDRHCHNHPWAWAVGLVLSGGYTEQRVLGARRVRFTYREGDANLIAPGDYHSIAEVLPDTRTLFVVGREVQDWGFLVDDDPDGPIHVPHREYFARIGTPCTHVERVTP